MFKHSWGAQDSPRTEVRGFQESWHKKSSNGWLALKIPAQVSLSIARNISNHDISAEMPIGINFYNDDPTLSIALEAITRTYDKLRKGNFSYVEVCLYSE